MFSSRFIRNDDAEKPKLCKFLTGIWVDPVLAAISKRAKVSDR